MSYVLTRPPLAQLQRVQQQHSERLIEPTGDLSSSGRRIAAARKILGFSQSQLAALIESGRGTVAVWENKDRVPEGDVLLRLADALHVSPYWLMMQSDHAAALESLTLEEAKALSLFRKLNEANQDQTLSQMEFLLGRQSAVPPRTTSKDNPRLPGKIRR